MTIVKKCIKCNIENTFENNRYKICSECNVIKKSSKSKEIIKEINKESIFNIESIICVIEEVASFLTIYDIESMSLVSKEYREIIVNHPCIYKKVLQLDNSIDNKVYIQKLFSCYLSVDKGERCVKCCKSYDKCGRRCRLRVNISKTDCMLFYELSENDLGLFRYEKKYIPLYKKYGTFYNRYEIMKYAMKKHGGLTNFNIYKNIKNIKKNKARQVLLENKKDKEFKLGLWKQHYHKSFDYSELTNAQRRNMLFEYCIENDREFREDESFIIQDFIDGDLIFSLDHIIAILKLDEFLEKLNNYVHYNYMYFNYNDTVINLMFNNRFRKKVYTWFDAVENIYKKNLLKHHYSNEVVNKLMIDFQNNIK